MSTGAGLEGITLKTADAVDAFARMGKAVGVTSSAASHPIQGAPATRMTRVQRVTAVLMALTLLSTASPANADSGVREASMLARAEIAASATLHAQPIYMAPVSPVRIERLFDPPPQPWHAGHRGIDIAAQVGAPVYAPGDGVVVFAGVVVNRGVVTVQHPNGLRSSLEPVDAQVAVGDVVHAGASVGTVGEEAGHCAPRTCVHWGIREGEVYLNPLDWLVGYGPVRLLPLE